MNYFAWLEQEAGLTSAALTVRAQAISPNDNGRLRWPAVMPRVDIPDIDIQTITNIDFRPVAERRGWNAPGRIVHLPTPKRGELSLVPIETTHRIEEYEMTKLLTRTLGNQDVFRQIIRASLPARVDVLTGANYRRIEIDVFNSWQNGTVTVRNPRDNSTYTVSYGFDAARYVTPGTTWAAATNAFNELTASIRTAQDYIGPVGGVMLRQSTLNEIIADAPNPFSFNSAVQPTTREIENRLTDMFGIPFGFAVNEDTTSPYTDVGFAQTKTKVWQTGKVAFIPANDFIGTTGFAPVGRAIELAGVNPDARIDVNGMTVYRFSKNDGKEFQMDAQVNAIPLPDENRIFVMNVGV
jgi:hypothetical protein